MEILTENQVADLFSDISEIFDDFKMSMQSLQNYLLEYKKLSNRIEEIFVESGKLSQQTTTAYDDIASTKDKLDACLVQGDSKTFDKLMATQRQLQKQLSQLDQERQELIDKVATLEADRELLRVQSMEFLQHWTEAIKPFQRLDLKGVLVYDTDHSVLKRLFDVKNELRIK